MSIRSKGLLKCGCGETVYKGSVFCAPCRAEINRKNAKVIKTEERNHQKKMRSKARKKK